MFSGRRKFPATKAVAAGAIGLGAGIFGLGPVALAAEPTQQEMLEQIKALQAKVEQLEARQQKQQAPQSPPAATQAAVTQPSDQAATIDSLLKDAERRSGPSMLQTGGFTAGYSKNKFLIQDEAGNFTLNPNIQFQFRNVINYRTDDSASGDGDSVTESGFEVRRLKFAFEGNAFGPNLTYVFKWATDRTNGTPLLEDAWFRYALGDFFGSASKDLAIRAGQFKDPTFHEEITSSKRQLAVDRSLANEVLGGGITDFIQAVSLIWDDGPEGRPLRAEIGYSDGINSDNTNFIDGGGSATYGAANPDWGAFTRVEYLAMGNWKAYDDFTAMGNTENLLVFGFGASFTETGKTTGGGDTVFFTGDAQYETGRLGLYGAYYGVYGEPASASEGGIMDWGFLVQGGFMLNDKWEAFGRYDQVELDGNRLASGAEDSFPEVTVGLNYYIKGHAAKFTIDGTYLPNGSPANLTGIGILDPDGDDSQFVLRSQFQLLL